MSLSMALVIKTTEKLNQKQSTLYLDVTTNVTHMNAWQWNCNNFDLLINLVVS